MNRLPLALRRTRALTGILAAVLLAVPASAQEAHGEEEFDPIHHTSDGVYLDFAPLGHVELPRLFVVRHADGGIGLDAFGSTASALRSGRYGAEVEHGVGQEESHAGDTPTGGEVEDALTAEMSGEGQTPPVRPAASPEELITSGAHLDATLAPTTGSVLLDLSVTRHLVFLLIGASLVAGLALRMASRYRKGVGRTSAPRGRLQNAFEGLVLFVRDDIARPNIGDKADRFLPYLLTAFFFILIANLLGLLPWGATATANIAVTGVLALFTFLITQVFASKEHWLHVLWPPGVPLFMKPILIPVEIMGLFIKPFALAIRLFANMTAGHLVILSFIGLIFTFAQIFGPIAGYGVAPVSVLFALFVYVLELLVAFLQAYVFTMLSAIFIGMSVAEHEHHDHTPEAHTREQPHAAGEVYERDGDLALTA